MIVKQVYNNVDGQLYIPSEVLPENGVPFPHHFTSTPGDNLIELAGKICYDSCVNPKSRASADYHKHINEVGHWSTHGHLNITVEFQIDKYNDNLFDWLVCFVNKPGFYILVTDNIHNYTLKVTGNLRAIREWFTFNTEIAKESPSKFDYIGYCLQYWARLIAPEAIKGCNGSNTVYKYAGSLVTPQDANEIWISYYIGGVSRSLTHELCRHGFSTGISQRSSRYCDESQSDWAWHPLIQKYQKEINNLITPPGPLDGHFDTGHTLQSCKEGSQEYYDTLVSFIEKKLVEEDIDKHNARKLSRGAARGVLGNALSTEMIFSANLAQWQRIILQRCSNFADSEIRVLCSYIFDILCNSNFLNKSNFVVTKATDNFGYHIEIDNKKTS